MEVKEFIQSTDDIVQIYNNDSIFIKNKGCVSSCIEALASFMVRKVLKETVEYKIAFYNGNLVSYSSIFNRSKYMSMKEYYKLLRNELADKANLGNLDSIYKILLQDFNDIRLRFIELFVADMFVLNIDRVPRNYGVLCFENHSLLAKPFDFDFSLLNYKPGAARDIKLQDLKRIDKNSHLLSKPAVGYGNELGEHKFSDLIDFCFKKYEIEQDRSFIDFIQKCLDCLNPESLLKEFETENKIEFKPEFKTALCILLSSRKETINQQFNALSNRNRSIH